MADYNSPWTGEQIDLAVYDMGRTKNFICIWGRCCKSSRVYNVCPDITSIQRNPDTGSSTGLYLIIYTDDTETKTASSLIRVINDQNHEIGTSSTWIDVTNNDVHIHTCELKFQQFVAKEHIHKQDGTIFSFDRKIIEVYRYQNIQKSPEPTC